MGCERFTVAEAAHLPTRITALLPLARLFVMTVAVAAVVVSARPAAVADGPRSGGDRRCAPRRHRGGRERLSLATRSDLPIEAWISAQGVTWIDRQLLAGARSAVVASAPSLGTRWTAGWIT
jgi:hypothetical protein